MRNLPMISAKNSPQWTELPSDILRQLNGGEDQPRVGQNVYWNAYQNMVASKHAHSCMPIDTCA